MEKSRLYIKIYETKEQWIESFMANIEELNEDEDFVHTDYPMPKDKDRIELYKGSFDKETGEIKLVYIYQQVRFINKVVKFSGKLEMIDDELYVTGELQPIYIDYWKELYTTPGVWLMLPVLVIGVAIQPEFFQNIIIIFLFMLVAFYVVPRRDARAGGKKIKKWLKRI